MGELAKAGVVVEAAARPAIEGPAAAWLVDMNAKGGG